jgi:Protein of unknown function (DUF2793)/Putative phage tail protein
MIWPQLIYYVVTLALSIALAPKPKAPRAAAIDDFDFPSAEEGRPIPVVFGEVEITGPNVLWYGDLKIKKIKKRSGFSKAVVGYKYLIGFHLGVCHGPVDAITAVRWDNKDAWTGNITGNASGTIDQAALFGGEGRGGGVQGDFDIAMGAPAQPVNTYLASTIAASLPAFRGIVSFIWKSGYIGNSESVRPIALRLYRLTQGWADGAAWYAAKVAVDGRGMNPAHVIYQALTDPRWGMGVPVARINDANFRAAADTLHAENFGLFMLWNQAASIEQFIQIVLDHIGGGLSFRLDSGRYELALFRGNYDAASLEEYDESEILSLGRFEKQAWGETVNEVTLVYTDPTTRQPTSITAQDLGNVVAQGSKVPAIVELKGIRNHAVAREVLGRELAQRSVPLTKITVQVNRHAWNVGFGDLFKFTYPDRQCVGRIFRVLKIGKGTLTENAIQIEALEDIYQYSLETGLATQAFGGSAIAPATPISDETTANNVVSATTTAPPASPVNGVRYFVPVGASGAWAGHSGQLAEYDADELAWIFTPIDDGEIVYVTDTATTVQVVAGTATPIGGVPPTRRINTQHSLTGGGDLSADRTLNLVGDLAAPGVGMFYGTNASGVRGWYVQSLGVTDHSLLTGLTTGDAGHTQFPLRASPETISGLWTFTGGIRSTASGLGAANAGLFVDAALPYVAWRQSTAPVDNRIWNLTVEGSAFVGYAHLDSVGGAAEWLRVGRVGAAIGNVRHSGFTHDWATGGVVSGQVNASKQWRFGGGVQGFFEAATTEAKVIASNPSGSYFEAYAATHGVSGVFGAGSGGAVVGTVSNHAMRVRTNNLLRVEVSAAGDTTAYGQVTVTAGSLPAGAVRLLGLSGAAGHAQQFFESSGTGDCYQWFSLAGVTKALIGVSQGANIINGAAGGDLCQRTTGGAIRFSCDGGATTLMSLPGGGDNTVRFFGTNPYISWHNIAGTTRYGYMQAIPAVGLTIDAESGASIRLFTANNLRVSIDSSGVKCNPGVFAPNFLNPAGTAYLGWNNAVFTYGSAHLIGGVGGYTGLTLHDGVKHWTFMSDSVNVGVYAQSGGARWSWVDDGVYFTVSLPVKAQGIVLTSSRKVKRETGVPTNVRAMLQRMRPILYQLHEGYTREQLGLIAEEVNEVCPQLSDGETIAYDRLAVLLLAEWLERNPQ